MVSINGAGSKRARANFTEESYDALAKSGVPHKPAYSESFLPGFRQIPKFMLLALAADKRLNNSTRQAVLIAHLEERNPGDAFALAAGHVHRATGMSRRSAERCIKKLVHLGWLIPERRGVGPKPSTFRINRNPVFHAGVNTVAQTGVNPVAGAGAKAVNTVTRAEVSNNRRIPTNTVAAVEFVDSWSEVRPTQNVHEEMVWGRWCDANISAGLRRPIAVRSELEAAQALAELISAGELGLDDLAGCMAAYLADLDDWMLTNGHQLRWLSRRINTYRNQGADLGDAIPSPELINEIETAAEEAANGN